MNEMGLGIRVLALLYYIIIKVVKKKININNFIFSSYNLRCYLAQVYVNTVANKT